ncbi:MAG: hypothetical protein KOO60_00145 [Gemmatimonadales bacterium]|nr:hypothetical protein [Gemmatimonadales bacterium]
MTFGLRRILSLVAMALIIVLMVVTFRYDAGRRTEDMMDLMVAQGRSLADVIAESSLHGLGVYNSWEKEANGRLLDSALWVAKMDSVLELDSVSLAGMVEGLGLDQVEIFGSDGRVLAAGGKISDLDPDQRKAARNLLEPLLSGKRKTVKLRRRSPDDPGGHWSSAGVRRPGGGAVLVGKFTGGLTGFPAGLGPGHMIRTLGQSRGIRYVVLQDGQGIQAASTDKIGFPLPGEDPFVLPLAEGQDYVSREFDSPLGPVVEVARMVVLGNRARVLLRVGLDSSLLNQMRQDIRKRTILRGAFLLASLVLTSSLLLAWQRQGVLNREMAKVTRELREKEEEVRRGEKLAAMGTLAAGVAHQVRNPLNAINMISQMLERQSELSDKVKDDVRHITAESGRIEAIVQQFLRFTKPREPVFEVFDLGAVVRDSVAVQIAANRTKSLVFITDPPEIEVELDHQFLVEILENLLRNAVDALGGEGTVSVTLQSDGPEVEINVADNGPGVGSEDRKRIFDLYFTTRSDGHGLGLSLATQMVAAMGGSLRIAEDPGLEGKGARFVVRLPLQRRT